MLDTSHLTDLGAGLDSIADLGMGMCDVGCARFVSDL